MAKGVVFFLLTTSDIWLKYQRHEVVKEGKNSCRSRKTLKCQYKKKIKAIYLENRKYIRKQIKNKCFQTGVNVCDRIERNQLIEMGFTYKKPKKS